MVDGLSELIMSEVVLLTISGELCPGRACVLRPSRVSGGTGRWGVLPQEATMLDKVLRGWLFLLGQAGGPKPAEWKYLRSGVMVWPL